jgi:soluble lytic murein transglycosylase-like protein
MSAVIVNVARLVRAATLACASLAVAIPAQAEGLRLGGASSKSRAQQFQRQTKLMDTRLATQYQRSQRLRPDSGKERTVTIIDLNGRASTSGQGIPRYNGNQRSQYLPHARAAARKHGIPEDLFLRLVQQESGWNAGARSHKGATGLAQLMPATAAKLGVNPNDPVQNLDGGARYLRMMYNTFGDWRLALAAYNAGPGAVQKHNGIPPYRETRNYVRIIAGG